MKLSPAQLNSGRDKQYYSPVWLTNKLGNNDFYLPARHTRLKFLPSLILVNLTQTNNRIMKLLETSTISILPQAIA